VPRRVVRRRLRRRPWQACWMLVPLRPAAPPAASCWGSTSSRPSYGGAARSLGTGTPALPFGRSLAASRPSSPLLPFGKATMISPGCSACSASAPLLIHNVVSSRCLGSLPSGIGLQPRRAASNVPGRVASRPALGCPRSPIEDDHKRRAKPSDMPCCACIFGVVVASFAPGPGRKPRSSSETGDGYGWGAH